MSERPILFSGGMVRAILAGEKTVTRRVLKRQPEAPRCIYDCPGADTVVTPICRESNRGTIVQFSWAMTRLNQTAAPFVDCPTDGWRCPYGDTGDALWVREAWQAWFGPNRADWQATPRDERTEANCGGVMYRATQPRNVTGRWVTPLFMPRWASRITLRVTDVRVERLHAITPAEVLREGVRLPCGATGAPIVRLTGKHPPTDFLPQGRGMQWTRDELLLAEWASLWCQINGRASWDASPWVWCVSFERETGR